VNFEPGRAVQHIVSKRFDNVTNGIHLTTHVAKQQGDADDVVDDGGDDA
jgi:glucan phosphorylase